MPDEAGPACSSRSDRATRRALRAVPGDQKKPDFLQGRLHRNFLPPIQEQQPAVARLESGSAVQSNFFGPHGHGPGGVAKSPRSFENIGESVAGGLDRQGLPASRGHGYVKVYRVGGDSVDRPFLAPEGTADDANTS